MSNIKSILLFYFIAGLFFSITLLNCKMPESDKTLFQDLSPEQTGIYFENTLHETDTFNALFFEYYYNGTGLAIGDINNDGLSDIFFGSNMEKSRLYLNEGDLKFVDITESSGINTTGSWVVGISMVDINQDGWLDIYLCVGGNILDDYTNLLYINDGHTENLTFTEQAKAVGLDDKGYSNQAAFFDYDRDGDLDMYLVTSSIDIPNKNAVRDRAEDGSMRNTDHLYRNDGINPESKLPVFKDVSREAGVSWDGFGLGICISDINEDGWPDVYVANDFISNDLLYINQGDGTFKDMVKDYFKHLSYSSMGMDIADFNNDGMVDVFVLDMQPEDYYRKRIMAGNMREYKRYQVEQIQGYSRQYIRNVLQLNNGKISGKYNFSDIGQVSGVFETDWSWAPLFADFDNDGYRDLFVGNGVPHDMSNMDFAEKFFTSRGMNPDMPFSVIGEILRDELDKMGNVKKPNVIFKNKGNLLFEDKTTVWGMDRPLYSTGSAFSDLDNDGDLDLVLNNIDDPASVYENTLINEDGGDSTSHFLRIHLMGSKLNQGGIGAKIRLYYDSNQQIYEHFPVRGFQSMVDPNIHFGLGTNEVIDSMHIWWPDGKVQYLYEVPSNQFMELKYADATISGRKRTEYTGKKLFQEISDELHIEYRHMEREFIDFKIQPLIPHLYSREGPGITVGDVNGDGLDDFFVGGSTSYSGAMFIQGETGVFTSYELPGSKSYEDMGALLFDADMDGDNDLYVVSGGTGLPPGNPFYADRMFINDDKGNFTLALDVLPENGVCGSQVTAADYDKDGDLDLFVCGRVNLEQYPFPDRSYLLRNDSDGTDNIRFTDITPISNKEMERIGLVSSALWTDYDQDGWIDLILAGEWMPITVLKNNKGKFINMTSESGLADFTGWWNSLAAADFDKDGDTDYVAGNLGLNSRFKVSQDQPMRIVAKDFDNNGSIDPVCSYYVQGKSYPIFHRNTMISQMPFIQMKFKKYEDYARATITDIFNEEQMEDAYMADSRIFNTCYIENLGDGTFSIQTLPIEAQFAPVFGILANDYDADGNCDILLVGNSYSSDVETGQYDAFIGLYLTGDGKGNFSPVPGRKSGFFVDRDAKGMAELTKDDGSSIILVAQNSGDLKVFRKTKPYHKVVRLENDDAYAEIKYRTGELERREFYYGSGYLSHSSRVLYIPANVDAVNIFSYSGKSNSIELDIYHDGPPNPDLKVLLDHPDVIATGHYAWYSTLTTVELQKRAADNVDGVKGKDP
ncbi:FG-GAP-like repeat-containing protein [Bacteroidota bacterium]